MPYNQARPTEERPIWRGARPTPPAASAAWAKASTADTPQSGQWQMVDVIPLGGGMPIMMKGEAIGGVGISGAMGGQTAEEACARAAIDAIAGELR
jgi:uncharacterized protein GlcG (DUF336 family)